MSLELHVFFKSDRRMVAIQTRLPKNEWWSLALGLKIACQVKTEGYWIEVKWYATSQHKNSEVQLNYAK